MCIKRRMSGTFEMVLPMDWASQRYKVFQPRIIRNGLEIERNTVDLVTEKWATHLNAY